MLTMRTWFFASHWFLTAARLAANRANAQKCTDPATAAGKARVALNALKHGGRTDPAGAGKASAGGGKAEACVRMVQCDQLPSPWGRAGGTGNGGPIKLRPRVMPRARLGARLRKPECTRKQNGYQCDRTIADWDAPQPRCRPAKAADGLNARPSMPSRGVGCRVLTGSRDNRHGVPGKAESRAADEPRCLFAPPSADSRDRAGADPWVWGVSVRGTAAVAEWRTSYEGRTPEIEQIRNPNFCVVRPAPFPLIRLDHEALVR